MSDETFHNLPKIGETIIFGESSTLLNILSKQFGSAELWNRYERSIGTHQLYARLKKASDCHLQDWLHNSVRVLPHVGNPNDKHGDWFLGVDHCHRQQ